MEYQGACLGYCSRANDDPMLMSESLNPNFGEMQVEPWLMVLHQLVVVVVMESHWIQVKVLEQACLSNHSQLWGGMVGTSLVWNLISMKHILFKFCLVFTFIILYFKMLSNYCPKMRQLGYTWMAFMKCRDVLVTLRKGEGRLLVTFPNQWNSDHKNSMGLRNSICYR